MYKTQHEDRCMKEFGKPFSKVHEFLDQFFPRYRNLTHRLVLHHRLGVELVGVVMGEEARLAARQHVLDDMGRLAAGPEEHMKRPGFYPGRFDMRLLIEDMTAMLGYFPDFDASYRRVTRHLKCGCGYPGPMIEALPVLPGGDLGKREYICPWCAQPVAYDKRGSAPDWSEAPTTLRFDILRELAVGSRFRNVGLPGELRQTIMDEEERRKKMRGSAPAPRQGRVSPGPSE